MHDVGCHVGKSMQEAKPHVRCSSVFRTQHARHNMYQHYASTCSNHLHDDVVVRERRSAASSFASLAASSSSLAVAERPGGHDGVRGTDGRGVQPQRAWWQAGLLANLAHRTLESRLSELELAAGEGPGADAWRFASLDK